MQLTLRYFAWVRERIGLAEEHVEVPESVMTVEALIAWLAARGPAYGHAFATPHLIRAAIDHQHVKASATIAGAKEVAFFPPVTGG